MTITQTHTVTFSNSPADYLVDFICELAYGFNPGSNKPKTRPEVFKLPRDTQPGTVMPYNQSFITVIEKVNP